MAVYVDAPRHRVGRMVMCHMLADSMEELLAMADRIGVARKWFQPKSHPHFDICKAMRAKAVAAGAIEVSNRELVTVMRRYRSKCAEIPNERNDKKGKPMSKTEQAIEAEIKEKGLTAQRITPDMLDAEIIKEQFHVFDGSCLTVCCLTLKNGFTVTGESACASPENFDAEIGEKIARENARKEIWPLLGFRLRDQITA